MVTRNAASKTVSRMRRDYAPMIRGTRESARRAAGTLRKLGTAVRRQASRVSTHPIQWALIGVGVAGLAWLLFSDRD